MNNQEATAEAIRAIVNLNIDQKSTGGQVRLWYFAHIDSDENMDRMAMLMLLYHDDSTADPKVLKINDKNYRIETVYSGHEDAGHVVLVPFRGTGFRPYQPVERKFYPKRELEVIKRMWAEGLEKMGIKPVYPDYSQKAKESFCMVEGNDWPREDIKKDW